MKTLNIMSLAWKILRNSKTITRFASAMKLAWVLLRRASIVLVNGTIEYTVIKALSKLSVYVSLLGKKGRKFIIEDNAYEMNFMNYELSNQII